LIVSGYAEVEGIAPDLPRLVKPFRAAELAEKLAVILPSIRPRTESMAEPFATPSHNQAVQRGSVRE
jgi:hypothetical protein